MRSAAELEDSTEKHPVTPGPVLPAREMLGDLLLETKKPAEALNEFEAALKVSPNRFGSLFGAARAARLTNQTEKAKGYYSTLVAMCSQGNGDRAELQEARAFLLQVSK